MDENGHQGSYPSRKHYWLRIDGQCQVCGCIHEEQQLSDVGIYLDPTKDIQK